MFESKLDYGPIPFCMFHSSFKMEGFDKFVEDTWDSMNVMDSNAIKSWVKEKKNSMNEAKISIKCMLNEVDKLLDHGEGNDEIRIQRVSLLKDLNDITSDEALDLSQKEKNRWSIEGDENSKYFYRIVNSKRSQLAIRGILHDGDWIFWKIMGQDIVSAVTEFFSTGKFHPDCNSTFTALIPKIHDAKIIKDFRPISLIGSIYKIIAKILANHLSLVISKLINKVQTTFIPNRQILDGPFILNELISWCKHKKVNAMIFKVDFKKAFDFVRVMEAGLFKVLPLYYMSIYKAPVAVLKDLEFIRRDFFNGVDKVDRKIAWVRWEKVLASKNNGDSVLKMTHPRLFALELKEDITVVEKMGNSSLNLSFRRLTRSGAEDEQYKNLVSITSNVLLPQMHDRWSWSLNASGDFTWFNWLSNARIAKRKKEILEGICYTVGVRELVVGALVVGELVGKLVVGELVVGDLVGELVVGELIVGDLMVREQMPVLAVKVSGGV
ncbi:RNA-directed DNA polymerase, eukaryota [Tanacetum coccineum]